MRDLAQVLFFLLVVRPLMALFIGLRVYGRQHLPRRHPYIIVANHSSHLDAVALLGLFPLKELKCVRPVAASDYFDVNGLRRFVSRTFFHIVPIRRKGISRHEDPLAPLEKVLRDGQSLIFFPEGTRSMTGDVERFHSGIAHLLERMPDVAVVPVYLANMGRSLPKGEVILVPFFCDVRIGVPISPRGSHAEVVEVLRNAVLALRPEEAYGG